MGLESLLQKAGILKKDEGTVDTEAKQKFAKTESKIPGAIHTSTEFEQTFNGVSSHPVSGVRKQEVIDYFQKVFADNNIPGPDYQEFKNALEDMKSQPLDEATKIKTIWISFKAMGLTPQKLIETAEKYKTLFATKLSQFDAELQHAIGEQVEKKQKDVENLVALNKKIDEDMRKLNDQKLKNEADAKILAEEIQKNNTDLTTQKNDWHTTYDDIIKEIDTHIKLINEHLPQK